MHVDGNSIMENNIDNTAELWVQKYKPNRYLDLLSDESTNRMLLHWLKLWDKVVFNKEINKRRKTVIDDKIAGMFHILIIIEKIGNSELYIKISAICYKPRASLSMIIYIIMYNKYSFTELSIN